MSTHQTSNRQENTHARTRRLWLLAGSLAVFLILAWQILSDGPLLQVDFWLQQAMQTARSPALVAAASWMTLLGDTRWVAGLSILASAPLVIRRQWRSLAGFWTTMVGAGLSILALKGLIYRPRPAGLDGIIAESSSFPSGNSIFAMALIGAVIALVIPRFLSGRSAHLAICVLAPLPLLVAASRVILSAHYLSDTVAGLAMGLAWVSIGGLVAGRR